MSEAALSSPTEGSAPARKGPTVPELEDMLYDILASGADPSLSPGALEAVQTFLHEHARSRRSQADFLAFFAKHQLPTVRQSPLSIALPPVDPRSQVGMPVREALETFDTAQKRARPAQPRSSGVWLAVGFALAAISGGAYYAFEYARAEIARVHAQAEAEAVKLATLQAQLNALNETVKQTAEVVREGDRRSELLYNTLVTPHEPAGSVH